MGWVVNAKLRPLYPGKDPVPTVQVAGWAPGPVWTGAENLAPTDIRCTTMTKVERHRFNLIPARYILE